MRCIHALIKQKLGTPHKSHEDRKHESKLQDLRRFSNKAVTWLFFYFNRQEHRVALALY